MRVARNVVAGAAAGVSLASCAGEPGFVGAMENGGMGEFTEAPGGFAEGPDEEEEFPILMGVMCVEPLEGSERARR